jgi:hypothetical protein
MHHQNRYKIILPGERLSNDTFWIPREQPDRMRPGCLLVVNERDGAQLAAHRTRLIPVVDGQPRMACMKCGRVPGVAQDQVACPYRGDGPCELVDIRDDRSPALLCAEHTR